ncbi:Transcriptional regulatory protein SrrA [Micromonospora sp. MW-13]|uniref:winged helix-turn-helix domain-containing protein n=1 Tax=Micromonospora sp. MW-13 TaxID=2094022 RepID=UPI000E43C3DB|nr:winged helix-turn-helix domain-containing protein [Micromonospora sp. MW-13]RGC69305.1 Transcriptional regulatory protein SrrA [Micromonospora sp. MW-13]
MSGIASLVIGIASSPAHRRQLAQLFGGTEAFLIVSSVDQARRFLGVVRRPAAAASVRAAPAERTAPTEPVADGGPPASELSIDSDRRVLCWQGREIDLTPLEHDFLRCLVGTPGHMWSYQRLHREVWGTEHLGRRSDMHSVVRRIRRKLVRLGASATIHAVRGVGLRLTVY